MARPRKQNITNSDLDDIDIDSLLKDIDKKFGKGSVFKLGEETTEQYDKGSISTGILSLDTALGVNGLPRGRIIEAYGPAGGGKTTLAIKAAAEAQKAGDNIFIIDAEHALDLNLVENTGIARNGCIISQPSSGEEALDIIEMILKRGAKGYIVIDSIAALVPQSELDKGFSESAQPGTQARLIASALRKLTPTIHKSDAVLICINQIRSTIGGMMGASTTTPGGHALKFWASVRIKIQNVAQILDGGKDRIGHTARIRIEKNKVAIPFKETEVKLIYGSGLSSTSDILNYAVAQDIIERSGAWYSYNGERLAQGELNAIKTLFENKELYLNIRNQVCNNLGVPITRDDMYCDKCLAIADKEDLSNVTIDATPTIPGVLEVFDNED